MFTITQIKVCRNFGKKISGRRGKSLGLNRKKFEEGELWVKSLGYSNCDPWMSSISRITDLTLDLLLRISIVISSPYVSNTYSEGLRSISLKGSPRRAQKIQMGMRITGHILGWSEE